MYRIPGIKGRLLARRVPAAEPVSQTFDDYEKIRVTNPDGDEYVDLERARPGETVVKPLPPTDDLDAVRAEAERIGMKVDRRLGAERLAEEIEKFRAKS